MNQTVRFAMELFQRGDEQELVVQKYSSILSKKTIETAVNRVNRITQEIDRHEVKISFDSWKDATTIDQYIRNTRLFALTAQKLRNKRTTSSEVIRFFKELESRLPADSLRLGILPTPFFAEVHKTIDVSVFIMQVAREINLLLTMGINCIELYIPLVHASLRQTALDFTRINELVSTKSNERSFYFQDFVYMYTNLALANASNYGLSEEVRTIISNGGTNANASDRTALTTRNLTGWIIAGVH